MRAVVQHYAEKEEVLKMMNNLAAAIERKETVEEKQDIQSALRFIFDLLNDQKNKNRVLDIMNTFSVDLLNYVKMVCHIRDLRQKISFCAGSSLKYSVFS
jgi:sugar diacid utilization regulator